MLDRKELLKEVIFLIFRLLLRQKIRLYDNSIRAINLSQQVLKLAQIDPELLSLVA